MQRGSLVQMFGPFVEPPEGSDGQPGWRPSGAPPPQPEDLHLETGEGAGLAPRTGRVCETALCSLLGHAAGAAALVVVPVLLSTALPLPSSTVRAFFVDPMMVPAPPPPPPPAPATKVVRKAPPPQPRSDSYFAPIEVPAEIVPEEGLDLTMEGVDGGAGAGVEGGVPGGVVGGVVGGLPDAAPPPKIQPIRVGGNIKKPVKVKHVPPIYPELATQAQIEGLVIIEAQVDERGRVQSTKVLRGVPLLNEAAIEAVRQWVYTPTLINGVPIPIVMTVTVVFNIKDASSTI